MYPVNEDALEILTASARGTNARLLASVNGSDFVLPVSLQSGGSVEVDGKHPAAIRKLSCQIVEDFSSTKIDPTAAEVRAEYGIIHPTTRVTTWVPVGTFVITNVKQLSSASSTLALEGQDRWQRVIDARFPRMVSTSGNIPTTIASLLYDADSRITLNDEMFSPYDHDMSVWDKDRDKAILALTASIGGRIFFNAAGVAVIRAMPALGNPHVWMVAAGRGGAKISHTREISRKETYNGVSVIGTRNGKPPLYAAAYDLDPSSVTQWGGSFGKRTWFYEAGTFTSQAQIETAAAAFLNKVRNISHIVTVQCIVNPWLESGDVILLYIKGQYYSFIVESFTIPLGLGAMSMTLRTGEEIEAQ